MNDKKRIIGLVGIVLLISGVAGVIPSSVNGNVESIIGFGILAILGMIFTILGFSEWIKRLAVN